MRLHIYGIYGTINLIVEHTALVYSFIPRRIMFAVSRVICNVNDRGDTAVIPVINESVLTERIYEEGADRSFICYIPFF